jgi:hypothetical protein
MEVKDRSSADLHASESAHMTEETKGVDLYAPPRKPERPFAEDYGNDGRTDARGRLLNDIEGRPLGAKFIVGRRFSGDPDVALSPEDIIKAIKKLDIKIKDVDMRMLPKKVSGIYGYADRRSGPDGDIFLSNILNSSDRDLVIAHEFGHAIDHFAGRLSDNLSRMEIAELRAVYGTLRSSPKEKTSKKQPENYGYADHKINAELVAEGLRAYMANPNYFKTVAPRSAAKIREAVNKSPYLREIIQFNSLGAAGLIGAGIGGQGGDNQ